MSDATPIVLRLKRREQRRVLAGHDWIFSNEIDTAATPLKGLAPGSTVTVESSDARFLAYGYVNPASLIAVRVTGRRRNHPFDDAALARRLGHALELRERRYASPFYRWAFGESDALPGLVIDRYDDVAVVQVTTAGMEARLEAIVAAIAATPGIAAVQLRNDAPVREFEALEGYRRWALGAPRDTLAVHENALDYTVPVDGSQKTGWFYDHRENRLALRPWSAGARVLDLYSYAGAFALNALAGGARELLAIDSSVGAVEAIRANARAQGVADRLEARADDALEALRALGEAGERFDVVVLDPPAFVKRRRDAEAGLRHYATHHKLALRVLAPGGILLTASCSQPVDDAALIATLRKSLPRERELLQLVAPVAQAPDHPVHPAMPETRYLSGAIARVA